VLTDDSVFYRLNQYQLTEEILYGSGFSERSGITRAFEGQIPMNDVDYIEVEPKWTRGKTLLAVGGVIAMVAIASDIMEKNASRDRFNIDVEEGYVGPSGGGTSCPFFYTYDGEDYHFESESFAGAVFRGGEYATYDVLEHLRPVQGGYRLRMTNERMETHYVNEVKILAVDAPADVTVIPDPEGTFHTIAERIYPLSCENLKGANVLASVRQTDRDYWQSDLASLDMTRYEDLRDGIILEFEKPLDGREAKLVVNGVNTTLGIHAFERLFALKGPNLARWHQQLDRDPHERDRVRNWMRSVGRLHVSVWGQDGWVEQVVLPDVGPAAPKDQVAVLDISDVDGDRLRVRLESTTDLWRIDEVYVDYSMDRDVRVNELPPASVTDDRGDEVADLLNTDDDLYLVTFMGSNVGLVFDAVPDDPRLKRTYALKAKGFYLTWSERGPVDQSFVLEMILSEPLAGQQAFMPIWKQMRLREESPASDSDPTGL
jgi:hypothetical protein